MNLFPVKAHNGGGETRQRIRCKPSLEALSSAQTQLVEPKQSGYRLT